MLITEKLETCPFSPSEQVIVDFILKNGHQLQHLTTTQIAERTFSSKSTLVRVAQKVHFSGWKAFKEAYLAELNYLDKTLTYTDANYPFTKYDSFPRIANKLAKLKQEVITETLDLLEPDSLDQAVQLLAKAQTIHIFAASNNLLLSREFALQMSRIQKDVRIHDLHGEVNFGAYLADPQSCALMISYSGESKILLQTAEILASRQIPLLLLTSLGDNQTTQYADVILRLSTREKLYSKISTFATDESILFLLDTLYACLFSLNYDSHLKLRKETSRIVEAERGASSQILQEQKS